MRREKPCFFPLLAVPPLHPCVFREGERGRERSKEPSALLSSLFLSPSCVTMPCVSSFSSRGEAPLSCCCRCRRSRQGRPPPAAKRVDVSRACKLASLPSFLFLLTSLFPFRSEKNPMLFPLFLLQGGNNWGGGGNNNNGGGNNNNGGGQVSAERRQASERKRRGSRRRRKSEGKNSPYLSLPLSRFLQTLPARLERRPEPEQGQQRRPERKRERRQRSQRKRTGS